MHRTEQLHRETGVTVVTVCGCDDYADEVVPVRATRAAPEKPAEEVPAKPAEEEDSPKPRRSVGGTAT